MQITVGNMLTLRSKNPMADILGRFKFISMTKKVVFNRQKIEPNKVKLIDWNQMYD